MRATAFLLCLGFLRAAALSPGDKAPLLEAEDSYGRPVDLKGSYVVLWFYPKAKSPGCTAQAKRYSELYPEFQRLGARVYGVSHDPAAEQCDFVEKLALKGGMIPDPQAASPGPTGCGASSLLPPGHRPPQPRSGLSASGGA